MKQLIHTIYILCICTLLAPSVAMASDHSNATERDSWSEISNSLSSSLLEIEHPTPQVEVRDGAIIPLCEYEQMQVFNVMGQEVSNEHLPAGVYLVRLVVEGETYTLKIIIR